jgi:hypothetical protein
MCMYVHIFPCANIPPLLVLLSQKVYCSASAVTCEWVDLSGSTCPCVADFGILTEIVGDGSMTFGNFSSCIFHRLLLWFPMFQNPCCIIMHTSFPKFSGEEALALTLAAVGAGALVAVMVALRRCVVRRDRSRRVGTSRLPLVASTPVTPSTGTSSSLGSTGLSSIMTVTPSNPSCLATGDSAFFEAWPSPSSREDTYSTVGQVSAYYTAPSQVDFLIPSYFDFCW